MPSPINGTEIEEPPAEVPVYRPIEERPELPAHIVGGPVPNGGAEPGALPEARPQEEDALRVLPILLVVLIVLFVSIPALKALRVYLRNVQTARCDNRKAVCRYFRLLLKYLKFFDFEMKKTETLFQFYERVSDYLLLPSAVVEIYAKACYGNEPITPEERARMKRETQRLAVITQLCMGKWSLLFYKYVLAIL